MDIKSEIANKKHDEKIENLKQTLNAVNAEIEKNAELIKKLHKLEAEHIRGIGE